MAEVNDIAQIRQRVHQHENDTSFMETRSRWEEDYALYVLDPYDAGSGYYSYTSNAPRVLADKVISLLTEANLMIHIPDEVLDDKETEIANNIERLLYGCYVLIDEAGLVVPNTPSVRSLKAWHSVIRGGFAERIYMYKNDKKETVPSVDIWDLYNTSYGTDSKGIIWAATKYKIPRQVAIDEYGYSQAGDATYDTSYPGSDVEVIDYWDRDKYCLVVGDRYGREPTQHSLGYCPVYIHKVGATPIVWQKDRWHSIKYTGASVFSANRRLYQSMNKTLSDLLTLVRRGVKVPLASYTFDGQPVVEEDIFQVQKAGVLPMRVGEKIEPVMAQSMPMDAAPLINWVSGELQRGGISHTALGELGFRLSGYAITQLQSAMSTVVAPFAETIEKSYLVECLEFLKQYSTGKYPAIKVRGRTSRNEVFGYPKAVGIKSNDIKGDWHPEVKLEPVLPKDDAQRYQLARLAREGEIPLLADETIRTELLGVRDADLEDAKIDREWADKLVINRLYDAYMQAVAEGRMDKAVNYLAELRRLGQPQGRTGASPLRATASGAEAAGLPGAGLPSPQTGVPSSTMPPEGMGGYPPGAENAVMKPIAEGEY